MSGHNKWSKVKRKKGTLDSKRSAMFSKLGRFISLESKKSGGDKNAPGLRAAVEKARAASMPSDNIERAILKGAGLGTDATEEVMYETYGPGGAAIIIVCLTDNRNRTGQEIKHLLSAHSCALGAPGSAMWSFTKTTGGYEPITPLELSENDNDILAVLLEELLDHDDVQDVYTNATQNI